MKKFFFLFLPILFVFSLVFIHDLLSDANSDMYREAELLSEVREKILHQYVEEVPSQKVLTGALQGMMSVLDIYCEYLDEDNFKQLYDNTEGEFIGIGVVITMEEGILTVISPVDDSPAAKAGILAGDKIVAINGEPADAIAIQDAIKKLKGEKGTSLVLTVIHEGSKVPEEITIVRSVIQIHSIKNAQMIDTEAGIGYLRLTKFNKHTDEELLTWIEKLRAQGMKSLILDVRFNPGGLMDAAIEIVSNFIESGVVVYTKGRTAYSHKVYHVLDKKRYLDLNLVVLVNKRSASASEIVAGSLQDYHRAIIVGQRTYGKGLVQTILPLRDGKQAIKLTTAKYFTPNGRSIQKSNEKEGGVLPDVQVPITLDEEKDLMQYFYETKAQKRLVDKQLQEAISLLKKQSIIYKFK